MERILFGGLEESEVTRVGNKCTLIDLALLLAHRICEMYGVLTVPDGAQTLTWIRILLRLNYLTQKGWLKWSGY